jgi:uncharacterized membrane protein YfcA
MPEPDIIALVSIIVIVAAVSQSVSGFGFALIMVPVLSLAWDVKSTVVLSTILSTLNLIPLSYRTRLDVNFSRLWPMLGGSFTGIPLGIVFFARIASDTLQIVVGVVVIIATLLVYLSPNFRMPSPDRVAPIVAGLVAGVLRGATSMGGPPATLYLISTERAPAVFRATMTWFLLPQGVVTVIGLIIAGQISTEVLAVSVVSLPAMFIGLTLGAFALPHVNPRLFRAITFSLLIFTAALAILNASGI